jgi:hypothetical protein
MVDLPRVNASKTVSKAKSEEKLKRWERMHKEAEQKRFEEKLFSNKRKQENLDQAKKRATTSDADIYRFKQNKEYSKFERLLQDSKSKNKNQQSIAQSSKQKFLTNLDKTKHKIQQDSRQKADNNSNRLTKKIEADKNAQQQRLEANQKSTKSGIKNILERNKQQKHQQNNRDNIAKNSIIEKKQTTELQQKENKLLQAQTNKQNKYNLDDKLYETSQQRNNANISKAQTLMKEKFSAEKQFADNIHKTQQTKQQVANSLKTFDQNTKKQQLNATRDKRNQDDSSFRSTEKAINDTSQQNKYKAIDILQKQQQRAEINKNQLDSSNIKQHKTTLDLIAERQSQDDISDKHNTDKISKNYLSQQQVKSEQIAKQDSTYRQYSKQEKQEKDEKISVEKLYQENKALPLPKNIDPTTTISQALQNPAQRVEVINHIVELIKTYRPFILKEGAFNIVMPGAFWEGTKIVVDIYKKDLEVKISASDQIVTMLEQNKSPLVEALKMADPNLNIKVDIKQIT